MSEKIYVVTLKRREDLEDFYSEMNTNGFRLHLKRPLSRNTHYYMTEDQAVTLRQDDRVVDVQLTPEDLGWKPIKHSGHLTTYPPSLNTYEPREQTSIFYKSGTVDASLSQWGIWHSVDCLSQDAAATGANPPVIYTFTGDITAGSREITNVSAATPPATPSGDSPFGVGDIYEVHYNWGNGSTGNTLRTDGSSYIAAINGTTITLTRDILGQGSATGVTLELRIYRRGKGLYGTGGGGTIPDDTAHYGAGRHVDVVIVDDPVSFDNGEWYTSRSNSLNADGVYQHQLTQIAGATPDQVLGHETSRFVQYQWFNELNGFVTSIDDDGVTPPGGVITYYTNAANPEYHGNHVASTAAGRFYGQAGDANIYGLQILGTMGSGQSLDAMILFDYLRAFHRNKPINTETGFRNPTITNHSWGYGWDLSETFPGGFVIGDITQIIHRGTTYNASNPGPSGWTMEGIETDFGIGANKTSLPSDYAALRADVEDAIEDGVVVIGAAGNDNFYAVPEIDPDTQSTHVDWNNRVTINVAGTNTTHYFNRGMSPCNAYGAICVGAISNNIDQRRADFTNFGPRIDVFAPGQNIVAGWNGSAPGVVDVKYGNIGAGDRFYPISGTSMASPQVAGIAACLATGKERFTNADLRGFLDRWSMRIMDFDTAVAGVALSGTGGAQTHDITTTSPSFSYYTLSGNDRNGSVSGNNATVTVVAGDTINFNLSNVNSVHPFYIRDAGGTINVSNPTANNQGSTGNVTVSWTPSAAGTYSYICGSHPSMKGTITVEPFNAGGIQPGSFGDYTCSQGSKNKTLRYGQDKWLGKNGASVSGGGTWGAEGVAREIKGERLSEKVTNQTFPRRNTLFRSWDHN